MKEIGINKQNMYEAYFTNTTLLKKCEPSIKLHNYLQNNNCFTYALSHDSSLRINTKGEILVPYYLINKLGSDLNGVQRFQINGVPKWDERPNSYATHVISGENSEEVIFCEGLITGLNIHKRYKGEYTVHVAGTTENLRQCAKHMLLKYPKLKIKIAVDHKIRPCEGPGLRDKERKAEGLKSDFIGRVSIVHIYEEVI